MSEGDSRDECRSCGEPLKPGDSHGVTWTNEAEIVQQLGDLCEDCAFQIQEIAQDFIQGSNGAPEYLEEVERTLEKAETRINTARENLRTAQDLEARSTEKDDIDLGGLPEEVQEQLEDIDFESGEELLGRFHLYLTNETGLSPGDTVDYVREMDYQLGLNPDDYPAKQYTHEDELTSSARDKFSKFLDSSYAEKTEKDSEEGV
ncbi:hypothetical protein [Natrinema sp. H-ect4]|uniref:hypothetical protein n=1 Tax=Natrinema sp. H-ect4 TaxID=3242699 RepID=UPI0035A8C4D8